MSASQTQVDPYINLILDSKLGSYKPIEYLGDGHFSFVFKARCDADGSCVALKVEKPNTNADAKFEFDNEGRLLAKLRSSSGVIGHISSGTQDVLIQGTFPLTLRYHAMELASTDLERLLVESNWLETAWSDRLKTWRGFVLGIHQMHLRDVAHRDLKSANCLLVLRGSSSLSSKVSDLGRSRDLGAPALHPNDQYAVGLGDLNYAPPEFLWWQGRDRAIDHCAADLYALGSLLFEMTFAVGLTPYALGPGGQIARMNLTALRSGASIDLRSLRSRFEVAISEFTAALPPPARAHGGALIRQISDPYPLGRYPTRSGRPATSQNLEWLLHKADILIKIAVLSEREDRASKAA